MLPNIVLPFQLALKCTADKIYPTPRRLQFARRSGELTHVDTVVDDADAFFPRFDPSAWKVVARESHPADARHAFAFDFVDYVSAGAGVPG